MGLLLQNVKIIVLILKYMMVIYHWNCYPYVHSSGTGDISSIILNSEKKTLFYLDSQI